MKQYLIAIAMVLALSTNANATAQKHRHTPRTEQVSDTVKHNQDAIEAFSDTTATKANTDVDADDDYKYEHHVTLEGDEAASFVKGFLEDAGGAVFLIPILGILCFGFFLPIVILILVFYFINRNRKEKYRLAQMAIQNGQQIPEELLKETYAPNNRKEYNEGIRQMFTGIGLAIFLGIILDELGIGIGALVFFIGLGKFIIARQAQKNDKLNDSLNGDRQNYDMNSKNDEL
jgi:uncharacterized membrane protein